MGEVRATDDEQLAEQLWGDDKRWDDDRNQWVPTPSSGGKTDAESEEDKDKVEGPDDEEVPSSPGSSSVTSTETTQKNSDDEKNQSPVPTTARPSKSGQKGSSTARSTGGSGQDKN
jgi:hypothetical protein